MIDRVVLKAGDLLPLPAVQVLDAAGVAVPLGDAADFVWRMTPFAAGLRDDVTGDARVGSEPSTLEYPWQEGDTDTPGLYRGEFRARFRDGERTIPTDGYIVVEIRPRARA